METKGDEPGEAVTASTPIGIMKSLIHVIHVRVLRHSSSNVQEGERECRSHLALLQRVANATGPINDNDSVRLRHACALVQKEVPVCTPFNARQTKLLVMSLEEAIAALLIVCGEMEGDVRKKYALRLQAVIDAPATLFSLTEESSDDLYTTFYSYMVLARIIVWLVDVCSTGRFRRLPELVLSESFLFWPVLKSVSIP